MNAAMTGDVESVKLLLSKGAEVNAVSGKEASGKLKNGPIDLGRNDAALTLAAIYGPSKIVRLVLNAGTDPSAKSLTGETAEEWAAKAAYIDPVHPELLELRERIVESRIRYRLSDVTNARPIVR